MARGDSARTPAAGAAGPAARRLADELPRRGGPVRQRLAGGLRELGAVDRAVYSAVAATPTPSLDEPLRGSPTPPITPASGSPSRPASAWRGAGRADVPRCGERWPSASRPRW